MGFVFVTTGALLLALSVYLICWATALRGIRENVLLYRCRKVVKMGKITHRIEGEESRPCDYIYMIYYENGKKRRLVEPSDSRLSDRLNELAA